jgi:hypothetical protein
MEAFELFKEVENGSAIEACKALLANKLESMSACGDFGDAYISSVYFPTMAEAKQAADNCHFNQITDVTERVEKFLELVETSEESFIVKCEVNGKHVFLAEVSKGHWYRIESRLWSNDFLIEHGELDTLRKVLFRGEVEMDSFKVHPFNVKESSQRLQDALSNCYNSRTLDSTLVYIRHEETWNELLDRLPHRVKRAFYGDQKAAVWNNLRQFL